MYRKKQIGTLLAEIAGNIEQMELDLKEEYKKLIRMSSDFEDIATDLILLERKSLPQSLKEYETQSIVDRLHARIGSTFGQERDSFLIMEAALSVMDENTSATLMSRN